MVKLSPKNRKLGKIPSVSIPIAESCPPDAACIKYCYNNKIDKVYKNVPKSYQRNWDHYSSNSAEFFEHIIMQIKLSKSKLFRWHVEGDIASPEYFLGMVAVAEALPKVRFLAFTKKYNIVNAFMANQAKPKNLAIIFSADDNLKMRNPHNFGVATIDEKASTCPEQLAGVQCDRCQRCFLGKSVTFKLH